MFNDHLVVNGVVHPYNWDPSNYTNPLSGTFSEAGFGMQMMFAPGMRPGEYALTHDEFMRDWTVEEIAWATLAESDCDLMAYHSTPLTDFYADGLVAVAKGSEGISRWPQRIPVYYGTVRPLEGKKAVDDFERQVTEMGVNALKLYPGFYKDGRTIAFKMNDERYAFPLFDKCRELGIKNVAIHKAIPFGVTAMDAYRPGDLDEAAMIYPDLNFQIIHAGWAFLEEMCFQLARFPNVYANLEATFSYIVNTPRKFAEVLGQLLFWGGPDKLIFGDGVSIVHPQPAIEKFKTFQFPDDIVEGQGVPPMTDEIRSKILGLNFLRVHGLDEDELKAGIQDDEFAQAKRDGLPAPWSHLRAAAVA